MDVTIQNPIPDNSLFFFKIIIIFLNTQNIELANAQNVVN